MPSAVCEPSRALDVCAENYTRSRRRSGRGTALTTARMMRCWTASSWTPEPVYWELCWAHCTNEVQVLPYLTRTRFRAPSVGSAPWKPRNRGVFVLFFLPSPSPERDGHRDNNPAPEEQRLHNDTNLPFPFIYQITARANRQIQAKYAHTLAHKHTLTDRCKIMHFLADSQSKSDDSNQFLDTNRASNPLMVQWKWTLQEVSLASPFRFPPRRS